MGSPQVFEDKGLRIAFEADAAGGGELMHGGLGRLRFSVSDAGSGEPVSGLYPAAWVDVGAEAPLDEAGCAERATRYLSGLVGIRPLVDLNSYFVLVLNNDATISVIDPIIGISGITKLYALILLPRPGGDWVQDSEGETLFVSMPDADAVAIVDLETFERTGQIATGPDPLRMALQPDGRYLWVGHGGDAPGVTVIDAASRAVVAEIATGAGHHEIAFSADSARALVTNRDDGTISVIDVRALEKVSDIETGGTPIAAAYSALSERAYVADGETGEVLVVDPGKAAVVGRIETAPGLGPTRVSQDGRWVLATNPGTDTVYVIDASDNRVRHRIPVAGRPYQVGFSRAFAYVRALDSERVSMIDLAALGGSETPKPLSFGAGTKPPAAVADLAVADVVAEAPGEAAVLVTSPADKTVYYYMEGMNAPMGNFRNYGHLPRAVSVVDRSLEEVESGVYEATMKLPVSGAYEVIFLLDSPRLLHCFRMEAAENPALARDDRPFRIVLAEDTAVTPGAPARLRFQLINPVDGSPIGGLEDVQILSFRAPGSERTVHQARAVGEAEYEIDFEAVETGAYYLYPAAASQGTRFGDVPYAALLVRKTAGAAGKNANKAD